MFLILTILYHVGKNNTIPPMTGNGKHTTFFSDGDIGMVY